MGRALDAAYEKLTVMDIAAACGRVFDFVKGGRGLCRSPFPELHTNGDQQASFLVKADDSGREGKLWKNFAGKNQFAQNGGLLAFARECKPGATDTELREWLVEIAGTADLERPETPEEKKKRIAEWKEKQKLEARRQELRIEQTRTKALALPPMAEDSEPWADFIHKRYYHEPCFDPNIAELYKIAGKLSDHRGWPCDWAEELVISGKISRCRLPWAWTENQTGWAFKCERPRPAIKKGDRISTYSVGYHQRFTMDSGRQWIFVPHRISKEKAKTDFQKSLAAINQTIEPMPFVIGDIQAPKIIVITEGQWDAATLYGALGGFDEASESLPVCVFGLRGVKNAHQLFRYWGNWLRYQQMMRNVHGIWILADNDEAGRALIHPKSEPGKPDTPCFKDVLAENFRFRIVASCNSGSADGKDFNDYYRANKPTVTQMWELLGDLRLLENVDA